MSFFAKARTTSRDIEVELFPLWVAMEEAVKATREQRYGAIREGLVPMGHSEMLEHLQGLPEVQAVMSWVEARLFIDIRVFQASILRCHAAGDLDRARRLFSTVFPSSYRGWPIALRMVVPWVAGLLVLWWLL